MPGRIQLAVKDESLVTLEEVKRGEKSLKCHTCGDRLAVKDGGGQHVTGKGRRHQSRTKHFSHTSNSKCHGEGAAHFVVKTALCWAINRALRMPNEHSSARARIEYCCPDQLYGPNDYFKFAAGSGGLNQEFEQLRRGYHSYDLIYCSVGLRVDGPPALDRAECEVWLDGRKTRADIAGKDKNGNVLWVIEIKRSGLSRAAIEYAQDKGIPLFVVDLSRWPRPIADNPWAELRCMDSRVLAQNLFRGFLPSVTESYNTVCERKAFGMGPDDHNWSKSYVYIHRGPGSCAHRGCPDCEEVLLHECGEMLCPDSAYIFEHGITEHQMYTDPVHRANSHIPPQP